VNAPTIVDTAGISRVVADLDERLDGEKVLARVRQLAAEIGRVPQEKAEHDLDAVLARLAVDIAVERHAGQVSTSYTPMGPVQLLHGKDLSALATVVGTGGVFAYGRHPRRVLEAARYSAESPTSLRPRDPALLVDRNYVLFAAGLLAPIAPRAAANVMRRHLTIAEDAYDVD